MSYLENIAISVNPFAKESGLFQAKSQRIVDPCPEADVSVIEALTHYSPDTAVIGGTPSLSADQIDRVLQLMKARFERHDFEKAEVGIFFGLLINQSYRTFGNIEFTLTTGDYMIKYLPSLCQCRNIEHRLQITLMGNAGIAAAQNIEKCDMIIKGNCADSLGSIASESTFLISKDAADNLGASSNKCQFTVFGDAGDRLGFCSTKCTYMVHGEIGKNVLEYAHFCTLYTTNQKTFDRTCCYVPRQSGNSVILVDTKGKILAAWEERWHK